MRKSRTTDSRRAQVISLSQHEDPLLRFADEEDDGTPSGEIIHPAAALTRPREVISFVSSDPRQPSAVEDTVHDWSMGSEDADAADVYASQSYVAHRYEPRPERTVHFVALAAACGLIAYGLYLNRPDFSRWHLGEISDNVIELPAATPPPAPEYVADPEPARPTAMVDAPAQEAVASRSASRESSSSPNPVALRKGLDLVVSDSGVSIQPGRRVVDEGERRSDSKSQRETTPAASASGPVPDPTVNLRPQSLTRQMNAASLEGASAAAKTIAHTSGSPSSEEATIRRVLNDFQSAYNRLDATGTKRVWPTVDTTALSRVFQSLSSQHLELANCQIAVNGEAANATCDGHARIVPRDKDKGPRVESKMWVFDLSKSVDRWGVNALNVR